MCYKGLAFKESENYEYICRTYHGYVELIRAGRGFDSDMVIDEDLSEEREEEEDWEEETEEEEEE